ncbi:MAG TPA: glycosyltransferase, partial [Motilibacteraceae bacterium]|nr:glycosyltransferase [Motilibacteraceae bacterium]
MAAQPEQDRPVRVVMAVANDVSTDTRVQKTALSLARVGLDVVVLGYTAGSRREELALGPVRLIRVPVPWRLRDRRTAVRAARRKRRLHLGPGKEAEAAAKLRLTARAKDTALMPRPLALAQLSWITGARRLVHLSAGLERKAQRFQTRRWTEWDEQSVVSDRRTPWRRWLPEIDDYELAFAPVLDELAPDVIHAHDVHVMGIAARAVARARRRGRRVTWVYDAHELVSGLSQYGGRTKRVVAAYADLEREYVQAAAGVLTVSDALADELVARYRLRERPAVVMNTPPAAALAVHEGPAGEDGTDSGDAESSRAGIRAAAGVPEGVPLLVYSGGVQHARGVHTAVEALVELPEAHLAVVCVPSPTTWAVKQVLARAAELGVADRVHALPPVPPAEVATFLRTADVGLIPLLHFGSHEVALPNKLFEYLHAGLPLVVSDCRAQAAFVRDLGVGEVHRAEDAADLARAVRAVLADPDRYLAPLRADEHLLDPWSWEHQEERLWAFYRQVLGPRALTEPQPAPVVPSLLPRSAPPAAKARAAAAPTLVLRSAKRADRPVVGIGPANMAGQGWAWGKALERARPDVRVEVVQIDRGSPLLFPADVTVPAATFARDQDWQRAWAEHGLASWTHALLEAGRPLLGTANGPDFSGDVPVLRAAGVQVGLLFHGSEIRAPRRHAQDYPFSPFQDPDDELTARLQRQVEALRPLVEAFDGPT